MKLRVGDIVTHHDPTVHRRWVVDALVFNLSTDVQEFVMVTALDANSEPVPEYWTIEHEDNYTKVG